MKYCPQCATPLVEKEIDSRIRLTCPVESCGFIGVYEFMMRNQVIIAYHIIAEGQIELGSELESWKAIAPDKLRPWGMGTGQAVKDWLARRDPSSD